MVAGRYEQIKKLLPGGPMISASDMRGAFDGTSAIILSLSQQFNPKGLPSVFHFSS